MPCLVPRRSAPAFTLVELLIVVGVISIIAGIVYAIPSRMDDSRHYLEAKMNARHEAERMMRHWREDVALARSIEVDATGTAMTIGRLGIDGEPVQIVYRRNASGELRRIARDDAGREEPSRMSERVGEVAFRPEGRGWRVSWTVEMDDGVRRLQWPFAAIAVPLGEEERP